MAFVCAGLDGGWDDGQLAAHRETKARARYEGKTYDNAQSVAEFFKNRAARMGQPETTCGDLRESLNKPSKSRPRQRTPCQGRMCVMRSTEGAWFCVGKALATKPS